MHPLRIEIIRHRECLTQIRNFQHVKSNNFINVTSYTKSTLSSHLGVQTLYQCRIESSFALGEHGDSIARNVIGNK